MYKHTSGLLNEVYNFSILKDSRDTGCQDFKQKKIHFTKEWCQVTLEPHN